MSRTNTAIIFGLLLASVAGLTAYILFGASFFARFARAGRPVQATEFDVDVLEQVGVIEDSRLTEISGIGASIRYPGAFWVHNDSGNPPEAFLISESGNTLACVKLKGAQNIDWEDLCVFEFQRKSLVCIGDVGDNAGRRKKYQLYLFEEPELNLSGKKQSIRAVEIEIDNFKKLEFEYSDGPKNCEAIAWDQNRKAIFLIEKRLDKVKPLNPTGIYHLRLSGKLTLRRPGRPERISDCPDLNVTGADVSRDGKRLLMSNYVSGRFLKRAVATDWRISFRAAEYQLLPLPVQRQGESICFSGDGKYAFVASEYAGSPLWKINIQSALDTLKSAQVEADRDP